jgi:hypothetical protein
MDEAQIGRLMGQPIRDEWEVVLRLRTPQRNDQAHRKEPKRKDGCSERNSGVGDWMKVGVVV